MIQRITVFKKNLGSYWLTQQFTQNSQEFPFLNDTVKNLTESNKLSLKVRAFLVQVFFQTISYRLDNEGKSSSRYSLTTDPPT